MNHCKTCKHWTRAQEKYPGAFKSPDVNAGGICGSPKLVEDYSGTHERQTCLCIHILKAGISGPGPISGVCTIGRIDARAVEKPALRGLFHCRP